MDSDKYKQIILKMYELAEDNPEDPDVILSAFKDFVFDALAYSEDEEDCMEDGVYNPDKDSYWGG